MGNHDTTPPRKVKLSLPYIRNPERGRGLYWDTIQKGLVLQVQPTGQRSYKMHLLVPRKGALVHDCRREGDWIKGSAQACGSRHVSRWRRGRTRRERSGHSGNKDNNSPNLATRYVEEFAQTQKSEWKQGAYLVSKHVVPRLGHMHPADIKKADVTGMIARIEAPVVANQTLAATSAIFSWAMRKRSAG